MFRMKPRLYVSETTGPSQHFLKTFLANVPILHTLKTLENRRYSGVSWGYKIQILANNELSITKL